MQHVLQLVMMKETINYDQVGRDLLTRTLWYPSLAHEHCNYGPTDSIVICPGVGGVQKANCIPLQRR